MPRGVAIPELREQLFGAAERLLAREGPSGLVTRAITTEAGCAKGVLHNHFTDLDGFLAEFVQSRFAEALLGIAELKTKAGQATVAENLFHTAATLFESPVLAAHSIVQFRPSVAARLHQNPRPDTPNLMKVALVFTAYLDAEKELGRVLPDVDTTALALALVATVHHLLMVGHMKAPHARDVVRRVVKVLLAGALPRAAVDPVA